MAECSKTDSIDEIEAMIEAEVTEAMIEAAVEVDRLCDDEDPWRWRISAIYCAMERVRRRGAAEPDHR